MGIQQMKIVEIHALENSVIEREATAEEIAQREIDNAENDAKVKAEKAKVSADAKAKAALLERLGISAEEAVLLLG